MKIRHKAAVINQLEKITAEEHNSLRSGARDGTVKWGTTDPILSKLVSNFREEVKDYYYTAQRRKCCYCSFELQDHKLTYDAEHILDKDTYPEYMFECGNIAAVCKHCNISKSNQPISSSKDRFPGLSVRSADYSIVHPHLDEWGDYLRFDEIGRILPVGLSTKGKETIRICQIHVINATRLSDEFSLSDQSTAEKTLRVFHEVEDPARKRELFDLIAELASKYDHPGSRAIVEHLALDLPKPIEKLGFSVNLPLEPPNIMLSLPPPTAPTAYAEDEDSDQNA